MHFPSWCPQEPGKIAFLHAQLYCHFSLPSSLLPPPAADGVDGPWQRAELLNAVTQPLASPACTVLKEMLALMAKRKFPQSQNDRGI